MNILEIYTKYNIPPTLQLHQLRVASVAKLISENMKISVNIDDVVQACLIHDMANIIKFSFDYAPESFLPEGVDYWKGIRDEFIKKYGPDEHVASSKIAKEIGVANEVLELVESFGFGHADKRKDDNRIEAKICIYSDMRVSPNGILPLVDRIQEGLTRFKKNKREVANSSTEEQRQYLIQCMIDIERQIFRNCKIKSEDINNLSIEKHLLEMREYSIMNVHLN
jgi:hypothetical protein